MLRIKKGYGYWDLTKYPYGGDFKRFESNTIAIETDGPVKGANEIRLLLNDGRIVITDKDAILSK